MVGRYSGVSRYARIALVWAILETLIVVGILILERSGVLGSSASVLNYPLSIGFWLIFGAASFVGCYFGDELEGLGKALLLSQIIAVPLTALLVYAVAPPIEPVGVYQLGNYSNFEGGYFLVLGLLVFITSMAGSLSGWVLNSLVGTSRDFSLNWKRLILGLSIAVASISLPISPVIGAGEPLTALSVGGTALVSIVAVKSGLNNRTSTSPGPAGLLVIAGMLVFFLSAFSVSYIFWSRIHEALPILLAAQCLTLIAPSLVLFRLLVRNIEPDVPGLVL